MSNKLLLCLVKLTEMIGRPTSGTTLTAGLPLVEGTLTIPLFERAAARVDLVSKLVRFPLSTRETRFTVPIILLLKDNNACLLTQITSHYTAKIINPPNNEAQEITLDELEQLYTGNAFSIEQSFRFTPQSAHVSFEGQDKNWFWSAIRNLASTYSEVLVASFLINLFALGLPLFTMNVYDRVVPNHSYDTLWVLASGIFIVFSFDVLMRTLRSYFIDQAGKIVDLQVSATILEKVIGIKMMDRPQSVGAFANTIQSFDSAREFITSTTVAILVDLPFAAIFLAVIFLLAGNLVLVPLGMLPLILIFGFALQKPLIEMTKVSLRYAAEKQALIFEILSGIESVKANCAENVMQARWEQVVNLSAQVGLKLRFLVNLNMFFSIFVQQFSTALVVIVGVYKIAGNSLTMGGLFACSLLSSRALAPMSQIASILTRYHQTLTSLNSLDNIMKLPDERPAGKLPLHLTNIKGEIEFRGISFQYPGRAFPTLNNISFKVNEGEHVGIIGRVGSGKSTLAKLIMNLLEPNSGTIYFDGVDQSNLDLTELRQHIGYVPQDVTLFYGTLRDNITFGSSRTEDSNLIRAIEISGIDELIKPQLGSYEAQIHEGGKNLSGGQRRIIAIARALLLDPTILILDEPSHSMDNQTESFIKTKLAPYIQNKTTIIMTHRVSMLSLVDRIIIIDGGKIIMDGPRETVLQALSQGQVKVTRN